VDILVNNAGIIQVGPIDTMTEGDFQMAMGAMYWGVLYPVLAVLPQMRARRSGRIVNITSIGARVSVPHLLPYSSAKFAAFGLSQGLRAELAREGITVTTIVPGLMRTGSHLKAYFKGRREWEYTWFALGASMPLISMDAERAARQIVAAVRRGEATRVLSLPAIILDRLSGLFPGTTANILGIVNRVLPGAGQAPEGVMEEGGSVHERMHSPVLSALTSWGLSAARRFQK
jgi:NAD(P)-dependent dehydrogenase (short-subunit alcohol dehydrogenase family)